VAVPLGVTYLIASELKLLVLDISTRKLTDHLTSERRSHNMEFESELANMLLISVGVPCTAIFVMVVTTFMVFGGDVILTPGFRLMRSAYSLLGNLVRSVYTHACTSQS
jgi:hypothetical protein